MSPTALTMRYLRRAGYLVDQTERWIPGTNIRQDLFTVIDLVAITVGEPVLGVQCTSLDHVSARLKKATASPELAVWLKTGSRFQVFGWALRRGRWCPKIVEIKVGDMSTEVLARPPRRGRSRHHPGDLFAELDPAR